ncbi:hypothetical protein [Pyrococcus yayanosii]|uniref:hypothetical protein n=1 Tax=Pyrococcus yayanosii TaxID=1008460 RepID=UPI000A91000A|nr:hypothetical protein [Pyrococcus yayanosii]
MPVKFLVDLTLEELEESEGFGAWVIIEVNGKRIVWVACYIVQALSAILATVTFAVSSCDEIPYVLEKFEEEGGWVIRRNCRGGKLEVGFGTYEPVSPVVFRKEGDYLLIEAFEDGRFIGRERVEVREYVKAALEFLEECLKGTRDSTRTCSRVDAVKCLILKLHFSLYETGGSGMGTTYYVVAVFDKPWGEVLEKLSREFRYTRELAYQQGDRKKHLRFLFDVRGFNLVAVGEAHYTLRTTEQSTVDWFEVETYSKENMTLIQIETRLSAWMFVLSPELMKFLRKLMKAGAVLICGYTDDLDFRKAGFEENNQCLLYEWLVETVKRGKLEVLPSSITIVKRELLDLEDGLYELIEDPSVRRRSTCW